MLIADKNDNGLDYLIIQTECKAGVSDINSLKSKLEKMIKARIGLKAELEIVPQGELPRFITKADRVVDRRKGENLEKVFKKSELQRKMD